MKKNHAVKLVLAAVLAVAMVAGVGCSSDSGTTEGETTEETGETGEETGEEETPNLVILDTAYAVEDYAICVAKENTELLEQINGALAELKEEGTLDKIVAKYISGEDFTLELAEVPEGADNLIMGTNAAFPPYEYYENETIVGIDAEIAAAIANKLGMNLLIEDMEFGSIIAAVQSGKIDFGAAGMTVTEDRLANVNFTDSYATGIQSIIVTGDSPITSIDDLYAEGADYVIGVQQDTTGDIYATDDFGDDRVERYNKGADAVQALMTGKIDCVIIDNEPAKAFVEANN